VCEEERERERGRERERERGREKERRRRRSARGRGLRVSNVEPLIGRVSAKPCGGFGGSTPKPYGEPPIGFTHRELPIGFRRHISCQEVRRGLFVAFALTFVFVYKYTWGNMTLGGCPLSTFCSRSTPPREVARVCGSHECFTIDWIHQVWSLGLGVPVAGSRVYQPRMCVECRVSCFLLLVYEGPGTVVYAVPCVWCLVLQENDH